jgi:hypothetical protein
MEMYRTMIELGRRAFDDTQADADLSEVPAELIRAILAGKKAGPA